MSVVYALEEAPASTGPWLAVVGSPFASTSDVVSGLNASTSYFFRITAKDTILGISSTPTVVGPIVTGANQLAESAQNTRVSSLSVSIVPPAIAVSGAPSGSSLSVSWSAPNAIYDSILNVWSLFSSGTSSGVQVVRNGVVFQTTSNVEQIVYWNHTVWMQKAGGWFYYGGEQLGGNWIPAGGDPATTESPQQTDIAASFVPHISSVYLSGETTTSLSISWPASPALYPSVIIDQQGGSWQINSSGQMVHNGVADSSTSGTVEALYWNHTVYRRTSAWLLWNGTAWASAPQDPRTNSALGQSPSGTFVPNATDLIVDGAGAVWTLAGTLGSYQINRNGVSVQAASNIVELLYYGGAVYQALAVTLSTVTPGSGSFTDLSGNMWSIDSGGNVDENLAAVAGGSGTDELIYDPSTNTIYGQDTTTGNWFYWNGSNWTGPVAAPSPSGYELSWKFWNNGVWTSAVGDPRVFGSASANNPIFFDDFNTLNLYNFQAPVAGTFWQPASWFSPGNLGQVINGTWLVDPFNSATPFTTIYTVSNSLLAMRLDKTPGGFSAAVSNASYVGSQIQTANTFTRPNGAGYWEARFAVPALIGSFFAWYIQDNSGAQQIDILECVTDGSGHFGKFSLWDPVHNVITGQFYTNSSYGPGPAVPIDCTQMHQWGVEVLTTTNKVNFYVDRVQQATFALPAGYANPMFMILGHYQGNTSFGATITSPGLLPTDVTLDYVGYWASRPF